MKITKVKLQLNTPTGPASGNAIYVLSFPVNVKLKKSRKQPDRYELETCINITLNDASFAAGGDIIYQHYNTIKRVTRALVGITGTDRQMVFTFKALGFIETDGTCKIDFFTNWRISATNRRLS